MKYTLLGFSLLLNSLGVGFVLAQTPEPTQYVEEVFQADLVYPQEQGEVQLSVAPGLVASEGRYTGQGAVALEYGLTRTVQVEAEWSEVGYETPGALEVGLQFTRMNLLGTSLHAALGGALEVPFGARDEPVEVEPTLILGADVARLANLHVFAQVAAALPAGATEQEQTGSADPDEREWRVHLGALVPGQRVHLTGEVGWFQVEEGVHTYATPGVVWDVGGTWQIGFGMPVGLTEAADAYRFTGFVTYEFELFDGD